MAGSRPAGAAMGRLMRTAPAADAKESSPRKDTSPAKQKVSAVATPERPAPSSSRASPRASSSTQQASQRRPAGGTGNASSSSTAASPRALRTPQRTAERTPQRTAERTPQRTAERTPQRTPQRTSQRTPQRNRTPAGKGASVRGSPGLRRGAASKSGARPNKTDLAGSNSISPLALPAASAAPVDDDGAQETHVQGSSRASPGKGVVQVGDAVPDTHQQGLPQGLQLPLSSTVPPSPESHWPQRQALQRVNPPQAETDRRKHLRSTVNSDDGDNIKVCVRIRPLSASESADGEVECVHESSRGSASSAQHDNECWAGLVVTSPGSEMQRSSSIKSDSRSAPADESQRDNSVKPLQYSFDWVIPGIARQQTVYDLLGERVVQGVAEGFHGCFFAYGQTGSGKSHTIFGGPGNDRGLLLRISEQLFKMLKERRTEYIVKLSYLEIYNEKIRDLLRPMTEKDVNAETDLQIRHHPKVGVFVEGLMNNVVQSPDEVFRLLNYGHKIRAVGRTNMNAASSRSHAVVTLNVEFKSFVNKANSEEQPSIGGVLPVSKFATKVKKAAGRTAAATEAKPQMMVRRRACLHSVDLAGSERLSMAGNLQIRQQESKEINKSLWALSLMISRLAAQEQSSNSASKDSMHIPYRNSKLTYMLSNSLMGNCRTVMLACISPASNSWRFSESTLRFAASAKKIRTRPVKNEELDGDLVGSLRQEIEQLRLQLEQVGSESKKDIQEQLTTTQLLQKELGSSWEEQLAQAVAYEKERSLGLQSLGLQAHNLAEAWKRGETSQHLVKKDAEPYLVNVCDDPLLSGCLTYVLPRGQRMVVGSAASCEIQIDGLGVLPQMCSLISHDGQTIQVGCIGADDESSASSCTPRKQNRESRAAYKRGSLFKNGGRLAQVFVNNDLVQKTTPLHHGERLRIGHAHVFQAFVPQKGHTSKRGTTVDLIESEIENLGEQILAKEYHAHLKERIGPDRTRQVFRRLKELNPLIEEANDMTDELRGDEAFEMVFKAHVLTDITSTSEDPELAVVMRVTEKPDDITQGGGLLFNSSLSVRQNKAEYSTSVWSLTKFLHRLEVMRDLYHEVSNREEVWGLPTDLDPWSDDMIHVADPDPLTHHVDYVHHVGSPRTRVESSISAHGLASLPTGGESNGIAGDGSPGGVKAGTGGGEISTAAPSATPSAAGETSNGSPVEVPKTMRRKGSATEPDAEPSDEAEQLALRLPVLEVALHNALTGLAAKEVELKQACTRQEELQAAVAAKEEELKQLPTMELELRCAAAERDMLAAQLARAARKRSGRNSDDVSGAAAVRSSPASRGQAWSTGTAASEQVSGITRGHLWNASTAASDQAASIAREHLASATSIASAGSVGSTTATDRATVIEAQHAQMPDHVASAASIISGSSIRAAAAAPDLHHVYSQDHLVRAASAGSAGSITHRAAVPEIRHVQPLEHAGSAASVTSGGSVRATAPELHQVLPQEHVGSAASIGSVGSVGSIPHRAACSTTPRSVGAKAEVYASAAEVKRMISASNSRLMTGLSSVKSFATVPAVTRSGSSWSPSALHRTRSQPRMASAPWSATTPSGCAVVAVAASSSTPTAVVMPAVAAATAQERMRRARSAERLAVPVRRARSVEKYVVASPRRSPSAEKLLLPAQTRARSGERVASTPTIRVTRNLSGPAGMRLRQEVQGELGGIRQQLASLNDVVETLCEPPVVQPALPASLVSVNGPVIGGHMMSVAYGPPRESVISAISGDQCSC